MKKIAIARTNYLPLNTKTYNVQEIGLAVGLLEQNISTDIYSRFSDITETTMYYSNNGLEIRLIPLKGIILFKRFTYFPKLINKLVNSRYDVVQVHENSQFMIPFIIGACNKAGVKSVLYQGVYQNSSRVMRIYEFFFGALFNKKMNSKLNLVLAKTKAAAKFLNSKGFSNIEVLPVGLNYNIEENNCLEYEQIVAFRKKFDKVLLYIGIIEPRRNVDYLVEILSLLRFQKHKNIGLLLVGTGPDKDKINIYIKNHKLEDFILCIEKIPNKELKVVYQNSDIFLLASSYEIFGMVVLEALFYGLSVISTPTAGPQDILSSPDYGVCLDLNKDIWVEYILSVLATDCSAKKLNRTNYIKNNFNWNIIAKRYLELMKKSKNCPQ
ncbi:MAG: glycosyltransferase [bacterium]